jgi:hypothetical protein
MLVDGKEQLFHKVGNYPPEETPWPEHHPSKNAILPG